jgi:hypothetical protein
MRKIASQRVLSFFVEELPNWVAGADTYGLFLTMLSDIVDTVDHRY